MVLPIVPKFYSRVDLPAYQSIKTGNVQRRPYNLNSNFSYTRGRALGPNNPNDAQRWVAFANGVPSASSYAQAYERLIKKLGDTASIGVTLVQWRQADDMIRRRANQLAAFNMSLLKRSPVGVAASLGLSLRDVRAIMRTRYGVARSLSDLWLEFWFGWKPMVTDIYTACQVFDQDIPWGRMRASANAPGPYVLRTAPEWGEHIEYSQACRVALGIDVRLRNENVHLLNQFGLLNPAVVAFDAIPWSFVLGWFSNVNSWLRSFSDFAGFETSNGYVKTVKQVGGQTFFNRPPPYAYTGGTGWGNAVNRVGVSTLPRPAFALKSLSLMPTRALTAITLLVQKLPR